MWLIVVCLVWYPDVISRKSLTRPIEGREDLLLNSRQAMAASKAPTRQAAKLSSWSGGCSALGARGLQT